MLREPGENDLSGEVTNPAQRRRNWGAGFPLLHLDYQNYWFGGVVEAHGTYVKDETNCAGFFAPEGMINGGTQLSPYGTNSSGTLQKQDASAHPGNIGSARPTFFDGRWYYVNRSTNNLLSVTLTSPLNPRVEASSVTYGSNQKDRVGLGSGIPFLWFKTQNDKRLQYWEGTQPSTLQTSLDLRGSDLVIDQFDVANGRVAVKVTDTDREETGIFTYEETGTFRTLDESDVGDVSNPFTGQFGNAKIRDVYADPTQEGRFYAEVREKRTARCPAHIMVTEDSGGTWQRFSHEVDCKIPYNLAFNRKDETIYVSINGRGVFRGNLSRLNQDRPNLAVNLTCEDTEVMESGYTNCTVRLDTSGNVSRFRNRVAGPDIRIDLPFRTLRYSIPDGQWQNQGCRRAQQQPNFSLGTINCDEPLQRFPASQQVTFRVDLNRIRTLQDLVRTNVSATITFPEGPPDPTTRDNTDAEDLVVQSGPEPDRFETDPRFDPHDGENLSRAIPLNWSHDPRTDKHLACPENPQYPGGNETVTRLEQAGMNCAGVLFDPSDDAPLTAKEVWTNQVDNLSVWSASDVDAFNVSVPDLDSQLMKQRLSSPECGVNTIRMATQPERRDSGKPSFLFTLHRSFRTELDKGNVEPALRGAFAHNANITLAANVTVTKPGKRTWNLHSGQDTFIVQDTGTVLEVYGEQPGSGSSANKTKRDPDVRVIRTQLFTMSQSFKSHFVNSAPANGTVRPVGPAVRQEFLRNGVNLSNQSWVTVPPGRSWGNTTLWEVFESGETYFVNLTQNGTLEVYTREQVLVGQSRRNVTVETRGWLEITVRSTNNSLGSTRLDNGVNVRKLRPRVYRTPDPNTRLSPQVIRSEDAVTVRIPCPRSKEQLDRVLFAVGESGLTAGTYNLSMEYYINLSRPVDISRRKTQADLGPDVELGQHDRFDVDLDEEGWQRRHVDVEELERKIALSQVSINPEDPSDPDPGPRQRLELTVSTLDGPTGDVPGLDRVLRTDGGHPYIRIDHDREFRGTARLRFGVSRDVLDRNEISPDAVTLYRHDGDAGWRQVETEYVGETDTGHQYRSEFDGLSLFAVGVRAPGGDGNVTLSIVPAERRIGPGTTATFEVVADGIDAGVGSYELVVNSTDTSRARVVEASSGIGGEWRRELAADGSGAAVTAFAGDTVDEGPVTVATVTVAAGEPGEVDLPLTVDSVSDEAGEQYAIGGVTGATVTVTEEPVAPDVTGDGNPATDPDGDGLYEDLNGDGQAAPGDATVLFNAVFDGEAAVTNNVRLFDFSGDGELTPGDATVLFDEVF